MFPMMKRFFSGMFTRTQFLIGVALSTITLTSLVYGLQYMSLVTFSPNTTISSSEINQNFNQIQQAMKRLPLGFSVGIMNTFSIDSNTGATPFLFDSLDYDYTPDDMATDFLTNGNIQINETGYYQLTMVPRAEAGYGQLYAIVNETNSIASIYFQTGTMASLYPREVFFNSGDLVEFEISTGDTLVLNPEVFKIKLIKF